MAHVTLDLDKELDFFSKWKVTPTELFFVQMILLCQEGSDETELPKRFFTLCRQQGWPIPQMIEGLKAKGIILKSYTIPDQWEVDLLNIPLSKNFTKEVFKNSQDMYKELVEHYPSTIWVNGVANEAIRFKSSYKFASVDDLAIFYGKSIRWNPTTHSDIIDLIDRGKESGYNFCNITDFIAGKQWEALERWLEENERGSNIRQL